MGYIRVKNTDDTHWHGHNPKCTRCWITLRDDGEMMGLICYRDNMFLFHSKPYDTFLDCTIAAHYYTMKNKIEIWDT